MKSSLIIKQVFGTLLIFAIIFISAGRILYWQGLVYVAIGLTMFTLTLTVLRVDDELMKERAKPGEGAKQWDKMMIGLSFLVTLIMYIIAGLDSGRFHWSPDFNPGLATAGGILTAGGQLMFLIAQKQNKFFSSTVRIQSDRGHAVCNTGLYKVVRHPAYLGQVIQTIGFPLLFGSLWSIIPACMFIILQLIRTWLEDKTLVEELAGYAEFTATTKYRLFPYVW